MRSLGLNEILAVTGAGPVEMLTLQHDVNSIANDVNDINHGLNVVGAAATGFVEGVYNVISS